MVITLRITSSYTYRINIIRRKVKMKEGDSYEYI